jgi:hypothetical protein
MALQTFNFWELVLDGTQIFLGGIILLYLIRNKIKDRQLVLKAPTDKTSLNFNTEFIIQAIRQQSDLAFGHILETIEKERQTLNTYFELRETRLAPNLMPPAAGGVVDPVSTADAAETDSLDTIYSEIESLAGQGMRIEDISEKLKVPKAEVELVLKLKRLTAVSQNNKNHPQD